MAAVLTALVTGVALALLVVLAREQLLAPDRSPSLRLKAAGALVYVVAVAALTSRFFLGA